MYYFILDKLTLPITPSSISYSYDGMNKSYTLINDGEINILKDSKLENITFDFIIPSQSYAFSTNKANLGQKTIIDWLKTTKSSKKPFQFIIVRFKPNYDISFYTNIKVGIESYSLKESASDGFDIVCSIKLKRYKPYGTKVMAINVNNTTKVTASREAISSPKPKSATNYKVVKGDSLWKIAKRVYGDGNKYIEIAKLNGIVNPNLILVGQDLILPKL